MFPKATKAKLDLVAPGVRMLERRQALQGSAAKKPARMASTDFRTREIS